MYNLLVECGDYTLVILELFGEKKKKWNGTVCSLATAVTFQSCTTESLLAGLEPSSLNQQIYSWNIASTQVTICMD